MGRDEFAKSAVPDRQHVREGQIMEKALPMENRAPQELTAEEQAKVDQIRAAIDFKDPSAVVQYGSSIQSQISEFSDKILAEVKGKDTGYIGDMLKDLMGKIRQLDVDSLSESGGFLSRLSVVCSWNDSAKKFMTRYQSLNVQIMQVVGELEQSAIHDRGNRKGALVASADALHLFADPEAVQHGLKRSDVFVEIVPRRSRVAEDVEPRPGDETAVNALELEPVLVLIRE